MDLLQRNFLIPLPYETTGISTLSLSDFPKNARFHAMDSNKRVCYNERGEESHAVSVGTNKWNNWAVRGFFGRQQTADDEHGKWCNLFDDYVDIHRMDQIINIMNIMFLREL